MKNIIKIFFAVLLACIFTGCTDKNLDDRDISTLNEALKLTVEVVKVEGLTATIRITSDGSNDDTWYGFVTDESNVMKAYQNKLTELMKSGKIVGLKNSPSFMTQAVNLEPYTDYTYIVFGINKDGEPYGEYAYAKFTSGLIETNDWELSYNGRDVIKDDSGKEKEYEHTIRAKSSNEKKYFITAYEKDYYDLVYKFYGGIEPLAEYELSYLKTYIKYVNQQAEESNPNADKLTLDKVLFPDIVGGVIQDGVEGMNLYPGDWCALAIGVDPKTGRLSGEYSVSVFNIPEETATKEYTSWIGKWTWTGANGVSWDVDFRKGYNNLWYYMTGWEGFGKDKGLDITVNWNKELKRWEIYATTLGVYQFAEGEGYGYLSATYTISKKGEQPVENYLTMDQEGILICYAEEDENGTLKCVGNQIVSNGVTFSMDYLHYLAVFEESDRKMSNPKEGWPTFPITITPYGEGDDEDDEFGPLPKGEKIRKGSQIYTRLPRVIDFEYEGEIR